MQLLFFRFYDRIGERNAREITMQYLEITIQTTSRGIDTVASVLTASGFSDLVLEDQAEFESFLDENRKLGIILRVCDLYGVC